GRSYWCILPYLCIHVLSLHDPATTEDYTLSLHDALPISRRGLMAIPEEHPILRSEVLVSAGEPLVGMRDLGEIRCPVGLESEFRDRKSTRLISSHVKISYAVFCLKKKKTHSLHHRNNYYK